MGPSRCFRGFCHGFGASRRMPSWPRCRPFGLGLDSRTGFEVR
nr:MAG TPA: hypothetical protein [Caudoviricetes sp.]